MDFFIAERIRHILAERTRIYKYRHVVKHKYTVTTHTVEKIPPHNPVSLRHGYYITIAFIQLLSQQILNFYIQFKKFWFSI